MPIHDADAIVIGGGPAGSSCAIRLAQAGWRVVLIEQSRYPRQKVCGECLGAGCLQLVDELGLGEQLEELAGPEIRHVGWMTGTRMAIAEMPACPSGSHRYGRALGRDALDSMLLERARRVGVRIIQPAQVRSITGAPGDFACEYRLRSEEGRAESMEGRASAPVVIDAHGSWERGPAAREAQRREPRSSDLLAFKATFQNAALPPGFLPLLALPGGYGGMVVADGGRTTVACCLRRDRLRDCRQSACDDGAGAAVEAYLKTSCRGVVSMLEGARRVGPWRSVGPLRLGFAAAAVPGVFPVGNAAVEAHPLIGEGICMALQSAALLAALLGPRPASIEEGFIRACERGYALACRHALARRLYWAESYARIAMHRSVAAPLARLMQMWPRTLTFAARLAGKARGATRTVIAAQVLPRGGSG